MAQKTFEQSMKQLEQIVKELEDGDLPLEKALKKFEEGMKLVLTGAVSREKPIDADSVNKTEEESNS